MTRHKRNWKALIRDLLPSAAGLLFGSALSLSLTTADYLAIGCELAAMAPLLAVYVTWRPS